MKRKIPPIVREIFGRMRRRYFRRPVHQRPPRTGRGLSALLTAEECFVLARWSAYPVPTAVLHRTPAQRVYRAVCKKIYRDLEEAIPAHVRRELGRKRGAK
jgi:hypothetical protein